MNSKKLKLVGQDTEVEVNTTELEHDIDMHHARELLYEVAYNYIHSRIIDVEPDSDAEENLADKVKCRLEEQYLKRDYSESMWTIVEDLTINGKLHQKIDGICRELGYHSDVEPKEEEPKLNKYVARITQTRWFEVPVLAESHKQASNYAHDRFAQEDNPFKLADEDFDVAIRYSNKDEFKDSEFAEHDATKYTDYMYRDWIYVREEN